MATRPQIEDDLNALRIPPELRGGLPRGGTRARRRLWLAAAGAAAVAVVLFLVLRPGAVPVQVERALAAAEDPAATAALVASGYVVPHRQIEVGSKVTGKVAWIGVDKGDRVRQGQLLVRLEDQEFRAQVERARGALNSAEAYYRMLQAGSRPEQIARDRAEMEAARATYERVRGLVEAGVYSPQQLDDARARYETALKTYELTQLGPRQEEIDQARAAVEQARGELAYAQTQLDATRITAPTDGTILDRVVETGGLVTTMFAGDRGAKSYVVSLADLSDLRVELDINENDFARVAMGQKCEIVLEAYPDSRYRGEVVEISPVANREKGTIQVKVKVLEPDGQVRPEMLARVTFERPAGEAAGAPVVTIPRAARVERGGRAAVFVVENGRAVLRPVAIRDTGGTRLVVTEGLAGGEMVIVTGQQGLEDGARVTVSGSPESAP